MNDRDAISFGFSDTVLGACAIAWSARGIVRTLLPGASEPETRASLLTYLPDATEGSFPDFVRHASDAIRSLFEGGRTDLRFAQLDMTGISDLYARIYTRTREVLAGQTTTYGALAREVGAPQASRAVGHAMGKNPFPIIVPCHRVLAKGGKLSGFSAPGGGSTKMRMLEIEGALSRVAGYENPRLPFLEVR